VLACGLLSACVEQVGSSGGGDDCISHYRDVVSAATWSRLKDGLLQYDDRGPAGSVRIQEAGSDIDSPGDKDVVRVVDVLNSKGRRLAQFNVWRADGGAWRAGVWSQCID
jgi:hypothetical protein